MDWNLCVICQEDNGEPLKSPLKAKGQGDKTEAYGSFLSNVDSLVTTVKEMGNPFNDDCPELLTLDRRTCMDDAVVETVCNAESTGITR